MFIVSLINETDWPDILRVQALAYYALAPESIDVLKSKWLASPKTCFIARDQHQNAVAYLLTHPWADTNPPKLHAEIESVTNADQWFIHDLAVLPQAAGKGAASLMLKVLFETSPHIGQFLLVAVQGSKTFWAGKGFVSVNRGKLCSSYGEDAQRMIYRR